MSLGIPYVIGPVSEWLAAIVVEGCSPGATIIVQTDEAVPKVLAKGVSVGGRDFVPVVGAMHAKQRPVAFQTLPGDTTPTTPSTLAVCTQINEVGFREFACFVAQDNENRTPALIPECGYDQLRRRATSRGNGPSWYSPSDTLSIWR